MKLKSRNLSPIVQDPRNECAKAHCSSPAIKPPVQSLKDSLISDSDGKTWLMAENKGGQARACWAAKKKRDTKLHM